jgi:hypothetical protein
MDLFVAQTIGFDLLYVVVIIRLERRKIVWINVTRHRPRNGLHARSQRPSPWAEAPRYMIRDRDRVYGAAVTHRLRDPMCSTLDGNAAGGLLREVFAPTCAGCATTPSSWGPSCAAPHATRRWYGSAARRGDSGSTCGARQPSSRCPREHLRGRVSRRLELHANRSRRRQGESPSQPDTIAALILESAGQK